MKCLEKLYLEQIKKERSLGRVYEWSTYGEYAEPVLIDKCQYWKHARGSEDPEYSIMLRAIPKIRGYEMSLWYNDPIDGPYCGMRVFCAAYQIEKNTLDMWMTTQHLRLKDFDGRNIVWTWADAWDWWKTKCFNAHMFIKHGEPDEHELTYID